MALDIIVFLIGVAAVLAVLDSAIQTFLLPRSSRPTISRYVFIVIRIVFELRMRMGKGYRERDRIMALYTPLSLIAMYFVWLMVVCAGFTAMFWAIGVQPLRAAFAESGSSLLTLGFVAPKDVPQTILAFSEAAMGLLLVAVLIAYVPTLYSAWSKREAAVTMLEVRAGSPPSAQEMITRFHRLGRLDALHDLWEQWERWFIETEESHTTFAMLVFFRSPQPERSWVTAAGAVLDTASLRASALDLPRDAQAELCIRSGYIALRRIADFFGLPYDPEPKATDPISVTREQFDSVFNRLAARGVPMKTDREQAWRDFAGWRVNYDTVLLALADFTLAPEAPWSSDKPVDKRGLAFTSRGAWQRFRNLTRPPKGPKR